MTAIENGVRRLRGNPFRTHVHLVAAMHAIAGEQGFVWHRQRRTFIRAVEV